MTARAEVNMVSDPAMDYEVGDAVMTPNGVGVVMGLIDRNGEIGLVVSIATIYTLEQVAPFGPQLQHACMEAADSTPVAYSQKEPWSLQL